METSNWYELKLKTLSNILIYFYRIITHSSSYFINLGDEYRDLSYSKSEGIETFSNGTLYIQSVTQSHGGNFLCQAKNEIGAGLSKLISLTVHGKQIDIYSYTEIIYMNCVECAIGFTDLRTSVFSRVIQ